MMIGQVFAGVLVVVAMPWMAAAESPGDRMVLATTPKYTDEMRVVDGSLVAAHPGHQIELLQDAARQCGIEVEFRFLPWQRALAMVRNGDADGAFSTSWDAERATFGAFPMVDGRPDGSRAVKSYSYSLYVLRGTAPIWDGSVRARGVPIAAERGSAIVSRLAELGFTAVEVADNATMLRMVAGKRVAGAAVMTNVADEMLDGDKELAASVVRLTPPVEVKTGYVMLSNAYYAAHRAPAECFWAAIRDIKASSRHAERVRAYRSE